MEKNDKNKVDRSKVEWPLKKDDLLNEVLTSKERDELTPRAVQMFQLIAVNANRKLRYRNQMDKEDCISGGIEDLLKYWRRFDPTVSDNAFAFFTQMAKHGFAKVWKKLHPNGFEQSISLSNDYNI